VAGFPVNSVMTNFRAKVTYLVAKTANSIAKVMNSFAKVTNSIATKGQIQLPKPII